MDSKAGTAQSEETQDSGAAVARVDASLTTDGSSAPKATSFAEAPVGAASHDRSPQPEAGAPSDKVAVLGHAVWLMDLVAPFGGIDNALKDLKAALQGRSIKTLRLNAETQRMEVVGL